MNEQAFVERRFELSDQEVVARFYRPLPAPTGEYRCEWTINWPDRERRSHSCGIDGIQALLLATYIVHVELMESEEYRSGRLDFLGERDLGLPNSSF